MKRILPSLAVLACLLSALPAGAAGTVKIGSTSYASIEAAYEDAADNAVIVIHTDADGLRLTSDKLTIEKPVTLRGDGATADETIILPMNETTTGDALFVDLNHADAALENLTFAGGRNGTSSGASPVTVHDGTVSNCVVRDCSGTGTFGAVTLYDGVMRESVVRGNTFKWKSNCWISYGGGVSLCGSGGSSCGSGSPVMTNCVITGNKSGTCGGGVWVSGKGARVVDCVITNNAMAQNGSGGGVYIDSGTVEDCLIAGNGVTGDASAKGAAVAIGNTPWGSYRSSNPAIMRHCLIVENAVGNTAAVGGAVVYIDQAKARLEQCTVAANTTAQVLPTALYQSAGTVATCLFALNSDYYGRVNTASTFSRTGGTFTNCVCDVDFPEGGTTKDNQVGRVRFVDAPNGDYHLSPGCVAGHAGCYPFKAGKLAVSVCYDDLIHDRSEPIDFSLIIAGSDKSSLTYKWDFNGDGTVDATTADPTWTNPPWGTHRVQVIVENGGGNVVTGLSERAVEVLPHTTYVSKTGSPAWPYDTAATAASVAEDAIAAVGASIAQPGTVRVAADEFNVTGIWVRVTRPVRLVGEGPEETLFKAYNNGSSTRYCFYVDHPNAVLSGLTMWNGNNGSPSGLRLVTGIVTNCVVRDCVGGYDAGGVTLSGGVLTDSQIYRCTAFNSANAGRGHGGGVVVLGGLVENCVISNNIAGARSDWVAGSGGGVCQCAGIVRCCRILNNTTYSDGGSDTNFRSGGGAALTGSALMERCEIAGNWATCGGGVILRAGKICDVKRAGNGILRNCFVHDNTAAKEGGGVRLDSGTVEHCTIVANSSTTYLGGGVYQAGGTMRNSIVYENGDITQDTLANLSYASGTFDYNVYTPSVEGVGANNLTNAPGFVDSPHGDYTLATGSIAIDSGYDAGTTTNDYDGAKRPMKGSDTSAEAIHDRGAWEAPSPEEGKFRLTFGHTSPVSGFEEVTVTYTATVAGEGLHDEVKYVWTHPGGTAVSTSASGDSVTVRYATYGNFSVYLEATNVYNAVATARIENLVTVAARQVYVSKSGSHEWPYDTWAKASTNIQTAISSTLTVDGDVPEITVEDGDFTLPDARLVLDKAIVLKSLHGAEQTTLRPAVASRGVILVDHGNAVLDGFTLTGVAYGYALELARGTVRNCTVCDNRGSDFSAAVRLRGGLLKDCLITRNVTKTDSNSCFGSGGGVNITANATMSGCKVIGNVAKRMAGGIAIGIPDFWCSIKPSVNLTDVVVTNCVIACNTNGLWYSWNAEKGWNGSAIYAQAGLITHCVVTGNYNQAYQYSTSLQSGTVMCGEAAVYLSSTAKLVNSLVTHNLSGWGAQGILMDNASAEVRNCTVADNGEDGYEYKEPANAWSSKFTAGKLSNTIVWGDHGDLTLSNAAAVVKSHNWTESDPIFVSRTRGNWRLRSDSPCIDAGDNDVWGDSLEAATDLEATPRLKRKIVDVGCYEKAPPGIFVIFR